MSHVPWPCHLFYRIPYYRPRTVDPQVLPMNTDRSLITDLGQLTPQVLPVITDRSLITDLGQLTPQVLPMITDGSLITDLGQLIHKSYP